MNIEPKKVWVVGHKNPDTDSICAAISYAYLKNQLGERQYVPKRAGAISEDEKASGKRKTPPADAGSRLIRKHHIRNTQNRPGLFTGSRSLCID